MKLEVIDPSTSKTIKTYSVDLSMFDFQEWKDESEVTVHLNGISDTVAQLDSKDPETETAVSSNLRQVDFYLSDPLKKRVLSQLATPQTDVEESNEQLEERVSTPVLKSSTVLAAVALEILQNHHQRSDYKVKISHG